MSATPRPWRVNWFTDLEPHTMDALIEAFGKDGVETITQAVNSYDALKAQNDAMREALTYIAEGKGAFDSDQLKHCENCLEDAKATAKAALALGETAQP